MKKLKKMKLRLEHFEKVYLSSWERRGLSYEEYHAANRSIHERVMYLARRGISCRDAAVQAFKEIGWEEFPEFKKKAAS